MFSGWRSAWQKGTISVMCGVEVGGESSGWEGRRISCQRGLLKLGFGGGAVVVVGGGVAEAGE